MPEPECDPSAEKSRAAEAEATRLRAAFEGAIRDTTRFARLLAVLSEPTPRDRPLDRALATLSELFAADIVVLLDPAGTGTFLPLASIGLPEGVDRIPLSDAEGGYLSFVLAGRAPILAVEAGSDPNVDPQLRELGAETAVWLPVAGGLSLRGALILARCRPVPFTRSDVDLLSTMAHRIGLSLEQVQKDAQLTLIERYGRDVARRLDESVVAIGAVSAFPTVMGAEAAVLVLARPEGGHRCAARTGLDPAWDAVWCRIADSLSSDPGFDASEAFSTADASAVLARFAIERPPDFPVRALLAAPILREERLLGFLFALRFASAPLPPDSLQAAMLFSGQTAAALEGARLYRAVRDELAERARAEEERKRLEIQLRQAQRLEAIGTFAGGIAHDYNNLHLVILGNLEIAEEAMERDTEAYRAVESALRAAMQASELTRRFLTFTEGGTPVTEPVALDGLIAEAVTQALAGSMVGVEYRIPEDLWDLQVDRHQIRQAFHAIVVNAREAMSDGGTISVAAENVEGDALAEARAGRDPGRFVAVSITDRGPGIPRENLPRIFDPYFTTKDRGSMKGMGLGLAIAHSVVLRHRGRIEVESEPSVGTTFRLHLPASLPQRGGARPAAARPDSRRADKVRLLLLEDEQFVAGATIRMLHRLGFEDVEHALEGEDAVARFARAREDGVPFRLAILDLVVRGGMGGKETVRRLLEIDPALCAIVCSGYSDDPVMSRHREHGFRGVLQKPFRMQDLAKAIREALAS